MRYLTYMCLLVALATVLAACGGGGGGGSVSSDAVAKVDGTNITQAQFNALIAQAKRSYKTQRTVAHILVKTKALADKLYNQIKGGANFASLAKKYSQDPGSKSLGGKLTISKGQTVGPFDQTAFLLSTGQVSHPVKTQFGYHIIKALSDVKPAKTTPLSGDVKKSIKQQLEQQKKNDAMTAWTTNLQKGYTKKISYQTGYAPPATTTTPTTT
jgi:parvulin-like peptidyl-prolyl isomerase